MATNRETIRRPLKNWYHGGAPGLSAGDELLPADETGLDPRLEGDKRLRLQNIFITTGLTHAIFYAVFFPLREGAVYRVKPIGKVRPDPGGRKVHAMRSKPGSAPWFYCRRAEVIEVLGQPWHSPPDNPVSAFCNRAFLHMCIEAEAAANFQREEVTKMRAIEARTAAKYAQAGISWPLPPRRYLKLEDPG